MFLGQTKLPEPHVGDVINYTKLVLELKMAIVHECNQQTPDTLALRTNWGGRLPPN